MMNSAMIPAASDALNPPDFCGQFLQLPAAQRLSILQNIGLERYQQLLCYLSPTAANHECLQGFLVAPQQVKFPQLQGADLTGLDLRGMNLIRAKFNNSRLTSCCLRSADLIFGDFTGANLCDADLQDCTINEAQWLNAIVLRCDLRGAVGLTPQQQSLLQRNGAILY
jgi:uncharacterized protein YjbI with pentapeptide repeats